MGDEFLRVFFFIDFAEETRQDRRPQRVLPAGSLFGLVAAHDPSPGGHDAHATEQSTNLPSEPIVFFLHVLPVFCL